MFAYRISMTLVFLLVHISWCLHVLSKQGNAPLAQTALSVFTQRHQLGMVLQWFAALLKAW